ncbi:MAG: mandelate racemase/muconate lactonizing enzyme family protein [Methylobacteriaceae bacterium]|nr:mandelate racemase/muconate lactonizing enzyme family protein [Methylobacteriaceae bacterium]
MSSTAPYAIADILCRRFRIRLDEVLVDAMHGDHSHFDLVTVVVTRADGLQGTGYTYCGGRGAGAIEAVIRDDFAPLLTGRDARDVEALNAAMYWRLHYVGRGGIVSFAISALDIALWDLRGKASGQPLWRMAGGRGRSAQIYRGAIDLHYAPERMAQAARGYVAEGYEAVKIKIGRADMREDLARARATRDIIGADRAFMIDANYGYDVARAIEAARAFAEFGYVFFEEPTLPDHYDDYTRIFAATGAPLAQGENLHTQEEFDEALARSSLAFLQPDASNCGGVTGWLAAARAAEAKGVIACSHGMQELHVSLVAGAAPTGWVEAHSFPIDRYATTPLLREHGRAIAPDVPGTGVDFDWAKLSDAHDPPR